VIPPPELLATAWFPFILNFYWRVFGVFNQFPGQVGVSSWFRTPEQNRLATGSAESQHLFGLAMDLVSARDGLESVAAAARRAGLVAVPERDHVHVQLFPKGVLARAGVTFPG